ncbi:type I site-specific deoxyribonuclease, HsdR family protein [Pseudarthrobacter siccitolerans]|uniref:Type I restriction enzyme endonuclease subunit n=1 Tax=Pseudarthrobacter siccitolerans TaxID=861266 RepID=A0A024H5J5_9MICC|nr:HsdR family type I site-specific deoxyribonuclease [Pseudarthrobacter siccitolerans]CCQ47177.1 type I site-specific deoxyribonuclease, HsdR family protein [Pseudarthrobacter siccitolerans]
MVQFNEANSVRDFVRDLVKAPDVPFVPGTNLPRRTDEVMLEGVLKGALMDLNPEIAANPAKADEVIYNLRAILLSARTSPHPVVANEEFMAWLTGQKSMPFGPNGEHTTVRLIDFDRLDDDAANRWTISTEVTFKQGRLEKRLDLVLWCNGLPLVIGEAKTPIRPAYTWIDAAAQIHDDYEQSVPQFFVPNVFSFATEGKDFRYGTVGMPIELWGPWREESTDEDTPAKIGLAALKEAVEGVLTPCAVLDFLRFFTLYATDNKHRKIKIIARFQQFQATNLVVERVLLGKIKQGLIWHFQGSGKSLLMVFTALKLRAMAELTNPTILVVVDRIDLDTQITGTFNASDVPGLVSTDSREQLQTLLSQGARKIIITTIHKFGEAPGILDPRGNIIAMVDEAHRSQEGDYGQKMRQALPNAFLFGLTGTPINRRDRNTFMWFGSPQDDGGYLSRYSFKDSIRDGATLPLHFEPRLSEIHVDQEAIDAAFEELADDRHLSDSDKITLSKKAASIEVLIKSPSRVAKIAADIASHFQQKVQPEGFKAQVVAYDKASCVAYKSELDKHLGPETSTVVMSKTRGDASDWAKWTPGAEELEQVLARFNDPADPLKIIIVTAKLLTGFDAPILYCQYLDKPLKEHTLLQAITRTNRVYPPNKTHGLIVDYLGIFDDVAKSLAFDEKSVRQVISNIEDLKKQLSPMINAALSFFPGVDRTVGGYEGLVQAQSAIADDATKDAFGLGYSVVSQLWEALSPDPMLASYRDDYRWLTDVYESVRPSDITGRLVWHALGAKTVDLINQHIRVELPQGNESIVLDAQTVEDLMLGKREDISPEEIETQITARIARHLNNPVFIALGQRLNALRAKYADIQQSSLEFLRELLELARDTVAAEKAVNEVPREEQGKAALTELFEAVKTDETPIIVENIVSRIDEVVRAVRFVGWQSTIRGDQEVRQALRKTLYIQFKIRDNDVFETALGYIREYY